jgi:hypothetical protein
MALADLIDDELMKRDVLLRWKKFEFFETFIRDTAIPFGLDVRIIQNFIAKFSEPSLASSDVLRLVLETLGQLYYEFWASDGGQPHDFFCPITLERMVDPVVAADGFTYERVAIKEWIDSGKLTSPSTNEPLRNRTLVPNVELRKRLESAIGSDLKRFLEYYIFDVLFSPLYKNTLPSSLLEDLICIASGRALDNSDNLRNAHTLLPNDKSIEGILRELFKISDPTKVALISSTLEKRLNDSTRMRGYLDTPLSIAYVLVMEEIFKRQDMPASALSLNEFKHDFDPTRLISARQSLDSIAMWKVRLEQLSEAICSLSGDVSPSALLSAQQLSDSVVPLLANDRQPQRLDISVRVIRMYLLKLLGHSRGLSFVRNALMQPPLMNTKWLVEWKSSDDVGFTRFLGSNRLPRINPFVAFPLFSSMQSIISEHMQSGNIGSLDHALFEAVQANNGAAVCAALLLACFHEIALLSLLPQDTTIVVRQRCVELERWLLSASTSFARVTSRAHRNALLFYGLGAFSPQVVHDVASRWGGRCPLLLDELSSSDAILRTRFAAHVVASAIASEKPEHPFSFFGTLLFNPELLANSFFPTMPEDMTKMAQNVMGGRWYACPNGHPFYVDLCGRPTVIQNCAECGAQIGGEVSFISFDECYFVVLTSALSRIITYSTPTKISAM